MSDDRAAAPRRAVEVTLSAALWARCAAGPRRREWEQAARDLAEQAELAGDGLDGARRLALEVDEPVALPEPAFLVRAVADGARALCEARIPVGAVRAHLDEYLAIIARIHACTGGPTSPQFEALDMAKKIVHDEAGDTLVGLLRRSLAPDHATARRLFTLLVCLSHDTTR